MATVFSEAQFKRFRLFLSIYQDGSGQLIDALGNTLPGWRDFERCAAFSLGGQAQENKFIFDVLLPQPDPKNTWAGISCKMRRVLNEVKRTGQVTLELSNSAGKFWQRLQRQGINQQNYKSKPDDVGQSLISLVREWHSAVSLEQGGKVNLQRSCYLALMWSVQGEYQLYQFPLTLPDPENILWQFPSAQAAEVDLRRHLRGSIQGKTIFEWYGESGGQLKYYPDISQATWRSEIFRLEPLPLNWREKHDILAKARDYFPDLWKVNE